jgi:hypothetical protein
VIPYAKRGGQQNAAQRDKSALKTPSLTKPVTEEEDPRSTPGPIDHVDIREELLRHADADEVRRGKKRRTDTVLYTNQPTILAAQTIEAEEEQFRAANADLGAFNKSRQRQ